MPQLEKRGFRATFFLTRENMLAREADWRAAAIRGHELANHTLTHPCDLRLFSSEGFIRREVEPMEHYLNALAPGRRSRFYAYPCDVTNLGRGFANEQAHGYAVALQRLGLEAARTSEGRPNNPYRVLPRRYRLSALAVGNNGGVEATRRYLGSAAWTGGWAILILHDVIDRRGVEGGVSLAEHQQILG
jgi:peptidoglycan/xylan/chitin deacetylase (PgdA/CDA1 family)